MGPTWLRLTSFGVFGAALRCVLLNFDSLLTFYILRISEMLV